MNLFLVIGINPHFHFHFCILYDLFDPEGNFHLVSELSQADLQSVQECIRKRNLKLFRAKELLDSDAVSDMLD